RSSAVKVIVRMTGPLDAVPRSLPVSRLWPCTVAYNLCQTRPRRVYVLAVKENQPTLGRDIAAVFAASVAGLSPPPGGAGRGRDRARQ
ncbi:MAG TPA: hypothetical protein VKP69_12695, partial [Isosphaeraceae bacterium]|nr:hypothetical protein [Isosphaeraceae bacterium]